MSKKKCKVEVWYQPGNFNTVLKGRTRVLKDGYIPLFFGDWFYIKDKNPHISCWYYNKDTNIKSITGLRKAMHKYDSNVGFKIKAIKVAEWYE